MKSMTLIILFLVLLIPGSPGAAETDATAIDTLAVDIWPDYDKAAVLVLLTGTLPSGSPLPARVTLPLPESARINAVARIDARDGVMKDDILSSPGLGELSFITPDPSFRVEYYLPYAVKGSQRAFDFTWQAGLSVARFRAKVQQPAAASTLKTVPASGDIVRDDSGMNYYIFPAQSLPAGQRFDLRVEYTMDLPQLSVQNQPVQNLPAPSQGPAPPALPIQPRVGPGVNWPFLAVIVGSVLMVLAVIWLVVAQRAGSSDNRRR